MGRAAPHPLSASPSERPMGPGDFVWLAALGCAARNPTDTDTICRVIDTIAAGQWTPPGHLVCDCLDEMRRGGHLTPAGTSALAITATGHAVLSMLLAMPLDRPDSPPGQVGLRLKLAFLDLVDTTQRRRHLESLVCRYEAELASRSDADTDHPSLGCFAHIWRSHNLDHLRRDLLMLRKLAGFVTDGL